MQGRAEGDMAADESDDVGVHAGVVDAWDRLSDLKIQKSAIQRASEVVVVGRPGDLKAISAGYLTQVLNRRKQNPSDDSLRTIVLSMHQVLTESRHRLAPNLVDEVDTRIRALMDQLDVQPMSWDRPGETMDAASLTGVPVNFTGSFLTTMSQPGGFAIVDGPVKGGRSVALSQLRSLLRDGGATVSRQISVVDLAKGVSSEPEFWLALSTTLNLPEVAKDSDEFLRFLGGAYEGIAHVVLLLDDITGLGDVSRAPWGWRVLTALVREFPQQARDDDALGNLSMCVAMTGSSRSVTQHGSWEASVTSAAGGEEWLSGLSLDGIDSLLLRYAARFVEAFPSVADELAAREVVEKEYRKEVATVLPSERAELRQKRVERQSFKEESNEYSELTKEITALRAQIKQKTDELERPGFEPTVLASEIQAWTGGHAYLTHATIEAIASGAGSLAEVLGRPTGPIGKFRAEVDAFVKSDWPVDWPDVLDDKECKYAASQLIRAGISARAGGWASKFMETHFSRSVFAHD